MYRRRNGDEPARRLVDTSDLVPKALREAVEADNRAYVEAKKKHDYERDCWTFTVHVNDDDASCVKVRVHNSTTVQTLTSMVCEKVKRAYDPRCVRLRQYDTSLRIRRAPLGAESTHLRDVSFLSRVKTRLVLETKASPEDAFEPWIERGGVVVKVLVLRNDDDSYMSRVHQLCVRKSDRVADLRNAIASKAGISPSQCFMVIYRGNDALALEDDSSPLGPRAARKVRDGDEDVSRPVSLKDGEEVRVEVVTDIGAFDKKTSRLIRIFDDVINRVRLKICPAGNAESVATLRKKIKIVAERSGCPFLELIADRRDRLDSFRARVAEALSIAKDAFKMKRELRGVELKKGMKPLHWHLLRDGSRVYVEMGSPTEEGRFNLRISLLVNDASDTKQIVRQDEGYVEIVTPTTVDKNNDDNAAKEKMGKRDTAVDDDDGSTKTTCTRTSTCQCDMCKQSMSVVPTSATSPPSSLMNVKKSSSSSWSTILVKQLGRLKLAASTSNKDAKRAIHEAFKSSCPELPPWSHMRLRERGAKSLTKLYSDTKTLRQNTKLRDGLEIVVQRTPTVDRINQKSLLIVIRRWHPASLTLDAGEELGVDANTTVGQFREILSTRSGGAIAASNVSLAKPFAYKLADVAEIPSIRWNEKRLFGDASARLGGRGKGCLMFRNGTTVVYKDRKEKEMAIVRVRQWHPERFVLGSERTIGIERSTSIAAFQTIASKWCDETLSVDFMSVAVARTHQLSSKNNLPNLAWTSEKTDKKEALLRMDGPTRKQRWRGLTVVFKDSRKKERDVKPAPSFYEKGPVSKGRRFRPSGGIKIYSPEEIRRRELDTAKREQEAKSEERPVRVASRLPPPPVEKQF